MNEILFVILLIFTIVALIELIKIFSGFFLNTNNIKKLIMVLPVNSETKNVEYLVRQLSWKQNWKSQDNLIILLNMGADEDTYQICQKLSSKNELIKFFSQSEFEEFISSYDSK